MKRKLDKAFNPHCIAVVGDRKDDMFRGEFRWLSALKNFRGKLYSVQRNPKTIKEIEALGVKNYVSLLDIPDPIDLVIVSTPRTAALKILEDCIEKDVGAAHFFTAGFSESAGFGQGDIEEGKRLENLLVKRAKEANFNLIGPNCMGIFNPKLGVKQVATEYDGFAGSVGFISQSGNHAINFALEAHLYGVDINKSVSFGNGWVLDSPDYLEYFTHDPEIKAVAMYLEGVRDGKRFFSTLRDAAVQKPIVIWKGGRRGAGGRAIGSHTGSMATSQVVWDAAVKQCGAISVTNLRELIDTLKILLYCPAVYSNKTGIIGASGGLSVAVADAFEEEGIELPRLTQESYDELASFWNVVGGGYPNPIDIGNENMAQMGRILKILEHDASVDNIALSMALGLGGLIQNFMEEFIHTVIETKEKSSKPVMVVFNVSSPEEMQLMLDASKKLQDCGIPAFPSFERGARALRNAVSYYNFKKHYAEAVA